MTVPVQPTPGGVSPGIIYAILAIVVVQLVLTLIIWLT